MKDKLFLLLFKATLIFAAFNDDVDLKLLDEIKRSQSEECKLSENCQVKLPQHANPQCLGARNATMEQARHWYKLTVTPEYEINMPILDQTQMNTAIKTRFDVQESKWFGVYYSMIGLLNDTAASLIEKGYLNKPMISYSEYKEIFNIFRSVIKKIPSPHFFSQPVDVPTFTDILVNDTWRSDKYFVQRRLATQCAYALRKVTDHDASKTKIGLSKSYLMQQLNLSFEWKNRLTYVYGNEMTLEKAIQDGILYVLHHEEFNGLENKQDILDDDFTDNISALDGVSPIALFLLVNGHLKVVAIQVDYTKDSDVFAPKNVDNPEDDFEWLRAKGLVDIVDMAACQLDGHLVQTHSTAEIICNLYQRHFGPQHPLYHVMLHHCEGTSPVGALGITALINEERYMHRLFRFGHQGTRNLVNKFYAKHTYANADIDVMLKKRGLDSDDIKYYPYRDDGRIIYNAIKTFSKKYVKIYYQNKTDVKEDNELQSFVKEVSNVGQYRGFPKKFKKKAQVSTFIARFIWLAVLHAANSYPLLPNGAYVPIMPTKLYDNPRDEAFGKYAYSLPNPAVVITQEVLTFTLSSLRLNRLFDYGLKLPHKKGRALVLATFKRLNTCIQEKLEKTNEERHKRFDLTYQYMEPKWLPNSIHC